MDLGAVLEPPGRFCIFVQESSNHERQGRRKKGEQEGSGKVPNLLRESRSTLRPFWALFSSRLGPFQACFLLRGEEVPREPCGTL